MDFIRYIRAAWAALSKDIAELRAALKAGGYRRREALLRIGSWLAGLVTFVFLVWMLGTVMGPDPWSVPK